MVPMRDDLDKRTNGYKRRQESVRKSTDILVDLVSLAMSTGIKARQTAGLPFQVQFGKYVHWGCTPSACSKICRKSTTPLERDKSL